MAADQVVTSGLPKALALLPLPKQLSDSQRRGYVCVYGGEAVTAQASTGLGRRTVDDQEVFARVCQPCLSPVAMGALFDHASGPEPCPDCQDDAECDTARALNLMIRGLHR